MIKPERLKAGDRIAVVSLSWGGPGTFPDRYAVGKRRLEEVFGFEVVEMPNALKPADWLAKNPKARAEDFMQAFADPSIKGVISSIGGDDSIRLLPFIELSIVRDNPKVFVGYSDTTVSHFVCLAAGVVSFYGPSVLAGFAENVALHPYMLNSFRQLTCEASSPGEVAPNTAGWTVDMIDWGLPIEQQTQRTLQPSSGWRWLQGSGTARGHLLGGCIEVMDWLRGSEIWPGRERWKGAILFLETSEEAPSPEAVRRMLRALGAVGVLSNLSAILFGRPGGHQNRVDDSQYDEVLTGVVRDELGLNYPIVSGMDFGHTDPIMTLPIGIQAEIDCGRKAFRIVEPAVR